MRTRMESNITQQALRMPRCRRRINLRSLFLLFCRRDDFISSGAWGDHLPFCRRLSFGDGHLAQYRFAHLAGYSIRFAEIALAKQTCRCVARAASSQRRVAPRADMYPVCGNGGGADVTFGINPFFMYLESSVARRSSSHQAKAAAPVHICLATAAVNAVMKPKNGHEGSSLTRVRADPVP